MWLLIMKIKSILIAEDLIIFLEKRKLWNQYKKVKKLLLDWYIKSVKFKLREPKKDKIYYFRINKQYRVFWKLEGNVFKIVDINDHQN